MHKVKVFSIILTILAINFGAYSMILTLSLQDLVDSSELIVIASINEISEIPADKKTININNTLAPEQILKGNWDKSQKIVVTTSRPAGVTDWIEDLVQFPPVGERAVVFLKTDDSGKMTTVNTIQGIWPIDPEIGDYLQMGFGITEEELLKAIIDSQ